MAARADAAPVLAGSAGSTVVLWPFLVATASGGEAVELTSIHTDSQKSDHVIVTLPDWVSGAEPSFSVRAVGAAGSTVVLDVGDALTHTAMAIDPATGRSLWTRPSFSVAAVTGDAAVGTEADPGPAQATRVSAVSLSTGQPLWTRPHGEGTEAVSAGPALIAVSDQTGPSQSGGPKPIALLSTKTGATVATLPSTLGDRVRCLYDHATVTVCEGPVDERVGGRSVVAFDAQTGHFLWSMPISGAGGTGSGEAPLVTAAWHGHIYATDTDARLTPATTTTVTNGRPANVPLSTTVTTTIFRSRSGVADGTISGPIPVLVDDQACLAINPEHSQIFARPRAVHD